MTIVTPGSAGQGLVQRVIAILLRPGETWDAIEAEPATIAGLYRGYAIPLAALAAVCTLIGGLVFGHGGFGFTVRFPITWEIGNAVLMLALNLAMVYVLALIIEALAPNFDGQKDRIQAFKLAVYSYTPGWVAGVFGLLPALGVLALIGAIYGLVLLYKGLPKLMKSPQERTTGYFVTILVVAIVLNIVVGVVMAGFMTFGRGPMFGSAGPAGGTITAPGIGSVDVGKLEEMSRRAEAAAKQIESGEAGPVTDPDVLKGYLPASVAGYARGDVSASSGGAGGIEGSQADARYEKGDASIRLEVTDLGSAGALAGMASAFKVKSSRETGTGYEKVDTVGGRMTTESYDRTSKHGEYGVLVGERFMVQATGDGASMDELKAAVNAVGLPRLEALAKAN
jgi:hypothetical protein